ncbi:MAG TPA: DUF924 domain-containing protein, partial [Rhodospirillaceae bacterium]|nr:DUF924 domain-containing protein [Rhodospirillaceae bacterium]
MNKIDEILNFWFGADSPPDRRRDVWFMANDDFDATIREEFGADVEAALSGSFEDWKETPEGCLALILLLDQFPRNLFRGKGKAFAGDDRAVELAKFAIERGYDRDFSAVRRSFLYLPFEHSESLEDQDRSVALLESLDDEIWLDFAVRHRETVTRFGRFP